MFSVETENIVLNYYSCSHIPSSLLLFLSFTGSDFQSKVQPWQIVHIPLFSAISRDIAISWGLLIVEQISERFFSLLRPESYSHQVQGQPIFILIALTTSSFSLLTIIYHSVILLSYSFNPCFFYGMATNILVDRTWFGSVIINNAINNGNSNLTGATESNLIQTINLMKHITKTSIRIPMKRNTLKLK